MLDERWSEDVEEVGTALRRIRAAESAGERVRAAEASADGRDAALERLHQVFGGNGFAMERRDALKLLWHYDSGMPLPPWACEADTQSAATS